jgi:hypothetical protein
MITKALFRLTLVVPVLVCAALWGCSAAVGLPPVISYMLPAEFSGNVPYASTITAVFSRPMNPATVTASSFAVSVGGVAVAGTVSCSGDTATFTPTSPLPSDSIVTATVTTAAKDIYGTALAAARTWSFTTVLSQQAGNFVLFYAYTVTSPLWTRNPAPASYGGGGNVVSQAYNSTDGSVTLTITNAPGYQDNGFFFYVGELKYFNTLSVVATPGSGTYGANIYLDTSGDGQFFAWTGNVYANLGGDQYYSYNGPAEVNGVLTIDSANPLCTFGGHKLSDLKAGLVAGVTGATRAAIYIGSSLSSGSWTATIQTVKVN